MFIYFNRFNPTSRIISIKYFVDSIFFLWLFRHALRTSLPFNLVPVIKIRPSLSSAGISLSFNFKISSSLFKPPLNLKHQIARAESETNSKSSDFLISFLRNSVRSISFCIISFNLLSP